MAGVRSALSGAGPAYARLLAAHPLPTKVVTAAAGAVLSDALAQAATAAQPSASSSGTAADADLPTPRSGTTTSSGSSGQRSRPDWPIHSAQPGRPAAAPGGGEACEQQQQQRRRAWRYDAARTLRLVLFGAVVGTPLAHYWFAWLEAAIRPDSPTSAQAVAFKVRGRARQQGRGGQTGIRRQGEGALCRPAPAHVHAAPHGLRPCFRVQVLLDQGLMSPVGMLLFLASQKAMEGAGAAEVAAFVRAKMRPALVGQWTVWPTVQALNFWLVRGWRSSVRVGWGGGQWAAGHRPSAAGQGGMEGRCAPRSCTPAPPHPASRPIQVPLDYRIAFLNLVGIAWTVYMSSLANEEEPQPVEGEEAAAEPTRPLAPWAG